MQIAYATLYQAGALTADINRCVSARSSTQSRKLKIEGLDEVEISSWDGNQVGAVKRKHARNIQAQMVNDTSTQIQRANTGGTSSVQVNNSPTRLTTDIGRFYTYLILV